MMKTVVTVLGIVFVAIGLLGFMMNPILGIFETDTLHNVIHILSGVLALAAVGMGEAMMRTFCKVFGVVYGLVAILGFVGMESGMVLGLFAANMADHLLHVVLAAVFLWFGFMDKGEADSMGAPSSSPM